MPGIMPCLKWKKNSIDQVQEIQFSKLDMLVYTSIYTAWQYIHCSPPVVHHAAFGIRFDLPCAADKSPLHACGFHPCDESRDVLVHTWTGFVYTVLRHSSILRTQTALEKELGTGKPTVFQGNIMTILLNAVRIRWNDTNSVLCMWIKYISVYTGVYTYIP
jgi:hypothetical protein